MIKVQKEDFNTDEEVQKIKNLYSNVGAVTSFIGYVRDINNNKKVNYLNLEVYEEMAHKQLNKIIYEALNKRLVKKLSMYNFIKPEQKFGSNTRFDFFLSNSNALFIVFDLSFYTMP